MRQRSGGGEVVFEPVTDLFEASGDTPWILNNQDLGFGAEIYRRFKCRYKEEVWALTMRINNELRDEAIGRALQVKICAYGWQSFKTNGASDAELRAEIRRLFRFSGVSGGSGGPGRWSETHRWRSPSIELHSDDSLRSWEKREILKGNNLIREARRILGIPEPEKPDNRHHKEASL